MDSTTLEEAQTRLLSCIQPTDKEWIPLLDGINRISYNSVFAQIPQPPFHRSPLDGYALNHKDTKGANKQYPIMLQIKQTVFAGDYPANPLAPMEAARIMTGAMIPEGADCIIPMKEVKESSAGIIISRELKAHENFCFCGEDIQIGKQLVEQGELLDFALLAVLAGQGYSSVLVYAKPKIAILPTGDELITPGEPLLPGKIYNNNSTLLSLRLHELGAKPHIEKNCTDEFDLLFHTVKKLMDEYDMVITTGGTSIGQKDYMPQVAEALKGNILFHGIAMKPGTPTLAMEKQGKLLLCLSGNPHAAFCAFELLAHPAIKKMLGYKNYVPVRKKAITQSYFYKSSPVRRLIQANLRGNLVHIPEEEYVARVLSGLSECNCMIDLPPGTQGLEPNEIVDVILL